MDKGTMFECSDDDFMIRGHDKAEIKEMAKKHLMDKHSMNLSDQEVEAKIKEV